MISCGNIMVFSIKLYVLIFIDLSKYNVCMIIILSYGSICHLWNVSHENTKGIIITFNNVKYHSLQYFEIHIM